MVKFLPIFLALAFGACAIDTADYKADGSMHVSTARVFLDTAASIPVGQPGVATISSNPDAAAMSAAADALAKSAAVLAQVTAKAAGAAAGVP
jgi:hypothetical protein